MWAVRTAPYRQSERSAIYAEALARLAANGQTYPCFCSPEELQLSRKTQLAAGRPPRYARTCAGLTAAEVQRRIDAGKAPAIRFRVPDHRAVEFVDRVHGPQRFQSDDIGDFVIRRADGSVSFFLGNAVDDSAMGITLVLRGDDHLANTPRQLLLLEALGMPLPEYGHLPLVLAPSGTPLSKREGAASLTDLRAQGYLPAAICNYLVRLGHACGHDGWLAMDQLASHFDLARTSHSAARFDDAQLRHWQREALTHSTDAQIEQWLGTHLDALPAGAERGAFVAVVKGNVLFPAEVDELVAVVAGDSVPVAPEATAQITEAGPEFFAAAGQFARRQCQRLQGLDTRHCRGDRSQGCKVVHAAALGADRRDARAGTGAARRPDGHGTCPRPSRTGAGTRRKIGDAHLFPVMK